MCCGSSDTSFLCASCSRAWACSSRSRRSLYSLFHASFLRSNSSTSDILCTVLGSFGGGFSCCQRSPSSRTRRTFSSAFLSSSMLSRIFTSLCAGPLFIGPPLVTSGVGHHLTPYAILCAALAAVKRRQARYKLPVLAQPDYRDLGRVQPPTAPRAPGLRPALDGLLLLRDGFAVPGGGVELARYRADDRDQQPAAPLAAPAPAGGGFEGL